MCTGEVARDVYLHEVGHCCLELAAAAIVVERASLIPPGVAGRWSTRRRSGNGGKLANPSRNMASPLLW